MRRDRSAHDAAGARSAAAAGGSLMFSGFMANAWEVGTIVAIVAGVVGFFVVLRGAAFPAHAIPNGAFAGAPAPTSSGSTRSSALASFPCSRHWASGRSVDAARPTSRRRSRW